MSITQIQICAVLRKSLTINEGVISLEIPIVSLVISEQVETQALYYIFRS